MTHQPTSTNGTVRRYDFPNGYGAKVVSVGDRFELTAVGNGLTSFAQYATEDEVQSTLAAFAGAPAVTP